jgi:hypothetical protein
MGIDSQVSIYVSKVSLMDQPTPTDMTWSGLSRYACPPYQVYYYCHCSWSTWRQWSRLFSTGARVGATSALNTLLSALCAWARSSLVWCIVHR